MTLLSPIELLTLHASENLAQNTSQGKQSSLFSCSISDKEKAYYDIDALVSKGTLNATRKWTTSAKYLPGTNSLAYFVAASEMKKKLFMILMFLSPKELLMLHESGRLVQNTYQGQTA